MIYHINIGSNQGDSVAIVADAVALIAHLSSSPVLISETFESQPWGFESPHRFLNVGVEIETESTPEALLMSLQEIERQLGATPHRNSDGSYCDRNVDIDLICRIDEPTVINTDILTLPHPRMHLREFVLIPLNQLSPGWIHPILNLTPSQILEK